jgi:hypothetical protein
MDITYNEFSLRFIRWLIVLSPRNGTFKNRSLDINNKFIREDKESSNQCHQYLCMVLNLLNVFRECVMDHDIPKAIESNSNYLAALGLSTYTEILGGFRYGDLKTGREANVAGSQRYLDFVINYFDNREYERINLQLKEAGLKGLYGVVRSGLIHEYFIKKRSQIVIENKPSSICGISYNPKNDPAIIFYVKNILKISGTPSKSIVISYRVTTLKNC